DDLGFCTTTQKEETHETEAVWTLWRYLVGPEYQARYAVLRGLAPSLLELYQEEQFSLENPQFG
ncbi:MAG: ABC transporter substrate-binding protein, partial [Anaerolineae bacterium]|nr:ABC transporter substrate-binding protein [Anaerolineae bacterium]